MVEICDDDRGRAPNEIKETRPQRVNIWTGPVIGVHSVRPLLHPWTLLWLLRQVIFGELGAFYWDGEKV